MKNPLEIGSNQVQKYPHLSLLNPLNLSYEKNRKPFVPGKPSPFSSVTIPLTEDVVTCEKEFGEMANTKSNAITNFKFVEICCMKRRIKV